MVTADSRARLMLPAASPAREFISSPIGFARRLLRYRRSIIINFVVLPATTASFTVVAQQVVVQQAAPILITDSVTQGSSSAIDSFGTGNYRIAPGDELALKFFYAPELNDTVTVRPDGRINLELVGDVQAVDLTPAQLAKRLQNAYATNVREPDVSVEVEKGFSRQRVFVGGEVVHPGMQALTPSLTVMRALILAEGLKDTAAQHGILVLRKGANGRSHVLKVDVASLKRDDSAASSDPILQPDDVVLAVPSRVAKLNTWIDQYIRRNIPISTGVYYQINNTESTSTK